MQPRLAPMTLLAGLAAGVATIATYQWNAGLVLAVVVTLLVLVLAPPGWGTRLTFAVGNAVTVGAMSVARPEGDYLVTASAAGYTVLGTAVLALGFAIATLPRPRSRRDTDGVKSGATNTPELRDASD